MTLIIHITIALSSIVLTTYTYFRPSSLLLRAAYVLVGLTFATGFYMVAMAPAHILQACTSGLVYLGIVSIGIIATRAKLVRMQDTNFELK